MIFHGSFLVSLFLSPRLATLSKTMCPDKHLALKPVRSWPWFELIKLRFRRGSGRREKQKKAMVKLHGLIGRNHLYMGLSFFFEKDSNKYLIGSEYDNPIYWMIWMDLCSLI